MADHSDSQSHPVALVDRRDAGAGLHLVTLRPSAAAAERYRVPGQYIQVRSKSASTPTSGYFVLASEPESAAWEVLVRSTGGASDDLIAAPVGRVYDVAGPLGEGFPIDRVGTRTLVIAVVGSAVAVARPILRRRLRERAADATRVYVGARSAADVPLAEELGEWARAGAVVTLCLSRPVGDPAERGAASVDGVLPTLPVRTGWVQRVLAEDVRAGLADANADLRGAVVFAAGPEAMLDEVRALAAPEAHAHLGAVALEVVTNI